MHSLVIHDGYEGGDIGEKIRFLTVCRENKNRHSQKCNLLRIAWCYSTEIDTLILKMLHILLCN